MKKAFAIDMDDVTFNLKDMWAEKIYEDHGIYVSPKDWHTYSLSEVYKGYDDTKLLNTILKHDLFRKIPLMPNVKETLADIRSEGNKIVVVTARGWTYNSKQITLEALEEKGIKVDECHVVKVGESKGGILKQISEKFHLTGFVDDSKHHIHEAATRNDLNIKNLFLQHQKWNENYYHDNVKRIYDFSEIKLR